ncbi:MAG TPA: hypothetical protein DCR43_09035 [Bacteroidales bacterium]|nr:MAG: hypothetical protein A2X11_05160 [Bacteroidetes bacterium GWE2_42_24]OFY26593.1 MAG: hypothetical protein A2X09_03410 [Bacteroidetes bacterium GWF2_43_11]HAQ65977.1 hypothetical protein [Bacteroidales bacterium]HBZ67473.1 hypothetical protein [Bacteroidales bacterium]
MDYQEFFIETGRLFYAVAMADGEVQPSEQSLILDIIRRNLKELESSSDAFGTANAYYTEFEMERLIDFKVEPIEAFNSFVDFATENLSDISPELRLQLLQMAENVAESWNGVEHSEHDLLERLKKTLGVK